MPSIQVVSEQAYLGGLNPFRESEDCLTHIADLRHPASGPGRYFVKHYLEDQVPSKGLVNEVCGYTLAAAVGLPLPDDALIVELPAERIVEMHEAYAGRVGSGRVLVWATRDTGGEPLPRDPEAAANLLRPWSGLAKLIAFDSWVLIPDRSPENLARRRNRQLVVIDHGHLAGSVCWDAGLLPVGEERPHPFLSTLWGSRMPDKINQGIVFAAEAHAECLARAEPELNRFVEPLLGSAGDRIALLSFLKERADSSPDRMKRVLRMLA